MTHPSNAKIWVGKEEEYDDGQGMKMFVDGATVDEIRSALDEHPEAEELYFAHGIDPSVIREFENQIRVTVEVHHREQVPDDLRGMVNIILRVPNWINAVKQRDGSSIQVEELKPSMNPTTVWPGQKAYPDDKVIK